MESIQPNDPVPTDPTAVFGRRCSAYIIDFVILLVVVVIAISSWATWEEIDDPAVAAQICEHYEDLNNGDVCLDLESAVFVFEANQFNALGILILVIAVAVLNTVIISTITGGSVGKLAVGLRVVDKSTFERAGFLKHLLRWIMLIVDTFPWFLIVPLTGLILGLASRGHRRVGDFAAKTLVVKKSHVGRPTLVPGVNEAAISPMGLPGLWDPPIQPPPTQAPPTQAPPTQAPPTQAPPTQAPPTQAPPTQAPPTQAPPTQAPPTEPIAPAPTTEQPTTAFDPAPDTSGVPEPHAHAGGALEPTPEPDVASQAQASQPGVDAPMWDEARDTYIQWDPQLEAWVEWSESGGRWIPISQ